jgi:catechol 2,3-dioxygenase-like lactoylglutathione lyase family enzyme
MILHIDHVTVVVRDVQKAKAFFALLGFVEEKSTVISGSPPDLELAEPSTLIAAYPALRREIEEFTNTRYV